VVDPHSFLDPPAEPAFVRNGAGGAAVAHHAAVLVARAVLKAAALPLTEIFHGQQPCVAPGAGPADEYRRLLAALELRDNVRDQTFGEELVEPDCFQACSLD